MIYVDGAGSDVCQAVRFRFTRLGGEETNRIVVRRLRWCTGGRKSSFIVSHFSVEEPVL